MVRKKLTKLQLMRSELGLTQGQLAERAGLSLQTIFNLENGRSGQLLTLGKLAHALGVGVNDLDIPVRQKKTKRHGPATPDNLTQFRGRPITPDTQPPGDF